MQQPRPSKLKFRNSDNDSIGDSDSFSDFDSFASAKPTGTLRERFENEANNNAKASHHTRYLSSASDLQQNSIPHATKGAAVRSLIVRGSVAAGVLAAGLYWVLSLPNVFQKNNYATTSEVTQPTNTGNASSLENLQLDTSSVRTTESSIPSTTSAASLGNTTPASPAENSEDITLEQPSMEAAAELPTLETAKLETAKHEIPAASNSIDSDIPTTSIEENALPIDHSAQSMATQSTTLQVQTYRASIFSHPSSTTASETPISHGTEVTLLEQRGDWVKVEVNNTRVVGFIHITHLNAP